MVFSIEHYRLGADRLNVDEKRKETQKENIEKQKFKPLTNNSIANHSTKRMPHMSINVPRKVTIVDDFKDVQGYIFVDSFNDEKENEIPNSNLHHNFFWGSNIQNSKRRIDNNEFNFSFPFQDTDFPNLFKQSNGLFSLDSVRQDGQYTNINHNDNSGQNNPDILTRNNKNKFTNTALNQTISIEQTSPASVKEHPTTTDINLTNKDNTGDDANMSTTTSYDDHDEDNHETENSLQSDFHPTEDEEEYLYFPPKNDLSDISRFQKKQRKNIENKHRTLHPSKKSAVLWALQPYG